MVVMAFDGNAYNWSNIANSTRSERRISGRHGKATNNGKDGNFNAAFFNGHVTLLSTEPYTLAGAANGAMTSPRRKSSSGCTTSSERPSRSIARRRTLRDELPRVFTVAIEFAFRRMRDKTSWVLSSVRPRPVDFVRWA